MKILVVSDSHGDVRRLKNVIELHPDISVMIHLGDGERDFDKVKHLLSVPYVAVCGNCDVYSQLPEREIVSAGGKRIYCTHGFREKVKYGDAQLRETARKINADIALYGHTHVRVNEYDDGLYVFNPGSLRDGNAGIIEIVPAGIMCTHIKV